MKWWNRLRLLVPMTRRRADRHMAKAGSIPMTEAEIAAIVQNVAGMARRNPNPPPDTPTPAVRTKP